MDIFYLITSFLFFIWIIRNTLFWVSLWQLKEYRLDRVLIHLKETSQGKNLIFSPLSLLKFFSFVLYIAVVFDKELTIVAQVFVLSVFAVQDYFILKEIYLKLIKKPVFTLKVILIILLTSVVIALLYAVPLFEKFIWLVFIDKLIPFLISFFVFLFYLPTELYRDWTIEKAAKKISLYKKLLVIGITGSYGKSTTKDYVAQILSSKYNVLWTKGTNNTPIGIASTIINGLQKNKEIFVVEMGAYKRGEIAEMCRIVKPKIGILTAVNEQHLSLFGNIENTKKAKFELMESLPKNGLGIFNGNNENVLELYQKFSKNKVLYRVSDSLQKKKSSSKETEINAMNTKIKKTSLEFDVFLNKKVIHLEAPLIGGHNIENILPGVYIANYLGMTDEEIKKAILNLSPLPKTMIFHKLSNGIAAIDDTFNANPKAVEAAVNYLRIYKGKRIMVLQPMIELGKKAKEEHYKVARKISTVCDYLFLTNKNFYSSILKGIKEGNGKCVVKVENAYKISEFIKTETTMQDVVIFEGKEAGAVLNKICSSKS